MKKEQFDKIINSDFKNKTLQNGCLFYCEGILFQDKKVIKRKKTIVSFDEKKMKLGRSKDTILINGDKWEYSILKIIGNPYS